MPLTKTQIQQITKAYKLGASSVTLAAQFSTSPVSIIKVLREAGIEIRKQGRGSGKHDIGIDNTQKMYIIRGMLTKGNTFTQIAAKLDMSRQGANAFYNRWKDRYDQI